MNLTTQHIYRLNIARCTVIVLFLDSIYNKMAIFSVINQVLSEEFAGIYINNIYIQSNKTIL